MAEAIFTEFDLDGSGALDAEGEATHTHYRTSRSVPDESVRVSMRACDWIPLTQS